mgnify:CR=1 FL=1
MQEPERIPLNQLNTNYPRQQYRVLPETYENYRPSRRMQLPKIPGKKRRLLPQVNSATYTKKVADLNNRATPPGILPVGYPVFLPEEDLSRCHSSPVRGYDVLVPNIDVSTSLQCLCYSPQSLFYSVPNRGKLRREQKR